MVIIHSYVSLPEGMLKFGMIDFDHAMWEKYANYHLGEWG